MSLLVGKLIIDFSLFVLSWLVQLVVYPSFSFFQRENLLSWHLVYTKKITWIVAPLMFLQIGLISFELLSYWSWSAILSLTVCAAVWVLTFLKAVPLHKQLEQAINTQTICLQLEKVHQKRTILWGILFLWSAYQYLKIS